MRKVCVFTGSRSDYGPMRSVFRELSRCEDIELQVLVSGSHLVEAHGDTLRAIDELRENVSERVEMVVAGDSPTATAKSFALGLIGYAESLERLRPDVLVVPFDRYEALAAAIAGTLQGLPIAHVGGGEQTRGCLDDCYRNAISKLAHLHFTATEQFRRRLIEMGEDSSCVFTTGSPGLDTIRQVDYSTGAHVTDLLHLDESAPVILATYHPATADPQGSEAGIHGLLAALGRFPGFQVVFTGTNVDQGRASVDLLVSDYVRRNEKRVRMVQSLGQELYLNLVRYATVVVGNSSSGLIEVPALKTPTVNIGSRQDGRPRAASVIDVAESASAIEAGIRRALSPEHQAATQNASSPYGDGRTAAHIVELLRTTDLAAVRRRKSANSSS